MVKAEEPEPSLVRPRYSRAKKKVQSSQMSHTQVAMLEEEEEVVVVVEVVVVPNWS